VCGYSESIQGNGTFLDRQIGHFGYKSTPFSFVYVSAMSVVLLTHSPVPFFSLSLSFHTQYLTSCSRIHKLSRTHLAQEESELDRTAKTPYEVPCQLQAHFFGKGTGGFGLWSVAKPGRGAGGGLLGAFSFGLLV
jgi:hypothetical protein